MTEQTNHMPADDFLALMEDPVASPPALSAQDLWDLAPQDADPDLLMRLRLAAFRSLAEAEMKQGTPAVFNRLDRGGRRPSVGGHDPELPSALLHPPPPDHGGSEPARRFLAVLSARRSAASAD